MKNKYFLAANAFLRDQGRVKEQKSGFKEFVNMKEPPLVPASVLTALLSASKPINKAANDFAHGDRLEGAQEYEAALKEVSRMLVAQLPKYDAKGVQELQRILMTEHTSEKRETVDEKAKFYPKGSPTNDDEKKMLREHTSSLQQQQFHCSPPPSKHFQARSPAQKAFRKRK
jgi:hypothetical protein